MSERFLVTGALGCLGAWTVRLLVGEATPVVAFDLGERQDRLRLIMTPEELEHVTFVRGDITDLDAVGGVLDEHGVTHVVHLAALQVPFAAADPPRGALVNVVGTVNVFEAVKARREQIRGLVYASSAGVYSPADIPPGGGAVPEDAPPHPATHYGVHKLANEGTARTLWTNDGLPSVGIRPYIVYGPGRDQGVSSTPTLGMLAAARGEPYRISFGGRLQYHYAPDVARALLAASRATSDGAPVFNLGGEATHMRDIVAAIEAAAPEAAGTITFEEKPLPFAEELAGGGFERAIGPLGLTPLAEGITATVEHFRHSR